MTMKKSSALPGIFFRLPIPDITVRIDLTAAVTRPFCCLPRFHGLRPR
jgi:hypothetical protein